MSEKTIKAITLYQPWASLVAFGAKRIETRSWSTKYRGDMAIHSSKKFSPDEQKYCNHATFYSTLSANGVCRIERDLPLGMVIAVCKLVECVKIPVRNYPIYPTWMRNGEIQIVTIPPTDPEYAFGDYRCNRYAWILDEVRMLPTPIPATGHQRLWDFTFDDEAL